MKIKILSSTMKTYWYSDSIGEEFDVIYVIKDRDNTYRQIDKPRYIRNTDCVITELPESFCVKRCDDNKKWYKYLEWLVKQKNYSISMFGRVFVGVLDGVIGKKLHYDDLYPFGTEIHIDDMIKHIDYMERHIKGGEQFHKESQLTVKDKEFDLTTDEGRLAYARKYYPIGTKYIPLYTTGKSWEEHKITTISYVVRLHPEVLEGGIGYIYANGKWSEIIKEETNMNTQKLSRQGLKEIHSIACSTWKITLEGWGSRNPLEDYIELSQKEIDMMFNASDNKQKSILSKYLKQDDWSVDLSDLNISLNKIIDVRKSGEYENKSFWLSESYNWEIKKDSIGKLCLIPTKKK